jgi:hypothetical protein
MKRRELLAMAGAGVAAHLLAKRADAQVGAPAGAKEPKPLAAPCGLYCGVCPEHLDGKCHGVCGCSCGQCEGAKFAKGCETAQCVFGKGLESCADCPELPCTRLIMSANDPLYVTGAPNLENLRRRKRIGTDAWLAEQKQYWSDTKKRDRWVKLIRESWAKASQYEK